jgi:ubiquitin-protein ligase E3 A
MLHPLMVTFENETAVDAGGPSRDYYYLLASRLFSPDYGMFRIVNGLYWFNPVNLALDEPLPYGTLGISVALAVYNNILLPIRFPVVLYKKLLKKKTSIVDLEELDPIIVNTFRNLLKRREDVRDAALTFVAHVDNFGESREIPLIPNGSEIDVTDDNLDEFVSAYVDWYINVGVEEPFSQFASGFWEILKWSDLEQFAPDELDLLVSGERVIDWSALKENAEYRDGYDKSAKTIRLFWEVFDEMEEDEKRRFLIFTTGNCNWPLGGVRIEIQKWGDESHLPTAHTCTLRLSLPPYETKEEMSSKLRLAISETRGFGFR